MTCRLTVSSGLFVVAALALQNGIAPTAFAQPLRGGDLRGFSGIDPITPPRQGLDQTCIVSVLNRNTNVNPDGTWILPNVPANFGLVRARATCVRDGVTYSGESDPFAVGANASVTLPHIYLGSSTPIPTSLSLTAPNTTLTAAGQTVQLSVIAGYADGTSRNVTAANTGTSYNISNSGIASITPNGLVTAVRTGTVTVQALNEGRTALLSINVTLLGGVDSDHDGIPDDAEIRLGLNPNDPTDALLDLDHDGLTNLQEYRLGTDLRNPDTDGDGISDGDEVSGRLGFRTNPLVADTDGDGVRDLTEIQTGSDPTSSSSVNLRSALSSISVAPSTFTLVVNSISGTASVQLTVTGHLVDNTTIDLTNTTRGTNYTSSDLGVCNFGSPAGRVYAGSAGPCTITISNSGFVATAHGSVTNFTPAALTFVAVPGFANAVAVSGDHAYVAAGSAGLQVVSLSTDRTSASVAGSAPVSGNANDVAIVGNTAYVATSSGLQVFDITNPTTPVSRGSFSVGANAMGVAVRGGIAYVAAGSSLYLVNVTNPAAMIQASSLSLGGTAWGLAVDLNRNLAAVAMGSAGLKLVDISNNGAPVLRGTAPTSDARAVALNGTWAFVGDYNDSLTSVDITSLTAPVIRSHTTQTNGGRLQGVALAGNFALGADVLFVNGIPITDVSDPTQLQSRTILNFTQRDDNGMGIAVDASFAYLATEHSNLNRGGSSGDSRLYIAQFLPRVDLAGVPPTASITSPPGNATRFQGSQLTVFVNAIDDVAVASVDFLVNGQLAFTSTSSPYQYTFTVPVGATSLTLGARATDLGANVGTAQNIVINTPPDPLTLVTGRVLAQNGTALAGANVTAPGGLTGVTGSDGRFSIANVPTVLGNIQVAVTYTPQGQPSLSGSSAAVSAVPGGVTDVGNIQLIPASFITDLGTPISRCDDCNYPYTLGFQFPYYGTNRTQIYVGTNGYITFNFGDSTYTESLPAFTSQPRVAAFFDDLYAGPSPDPTAALYVNDSQPGRFVITYNKTPHYPLSTGPNTAQIQLYADGRIVFAYQGISSLNTGTIVGLSPGPNTPSQAADYSTQASFAVPANTAVYEYFNGTNLFDLDNFFIVYQPDGSGGYAVRSLAPAAVQANGVLTGAPGSQQVAAAAIGNTAQMTANRTATATTQLTAAQLANAEVIVKSSVRPKYVGMTNTDRFGSFVLNGVPPGGIFVQVKKYGKVIAQGSGVFPGGAFGAPQVLQIVLAAPTTSTKKAPQAQ